MKLQCYCTFVLPLLLLIDDWSRKNTAESFTVALTLTLGGYENAIAPKLLYNGSDDNSSLISVQGSLLEDINKLERKARNW